MELPAFKARPAASQVEPEEYFELRASVEMEVAVAFTQVDGNPEQF